MDFIGAVSQAGDAGEDLIAPIHGRLCQQGISVVSVATDSSGNFKINLPAGTYHLTMPALHGLRRKNMPTTLSLSPREVKRLDIWLDTGLR